MNAPVFYGDGESKVNQVSPQSTAPVVLTNTPDQEATSTESPNKKHQGLKKTGPFMQPDVFGMPKNEDLKETTTSTRYSSGSHGLTVPNQ